MEEKINDLLNASMRILGEDADIMIITHKDDKCGSLIHGSIDNCAKAIFACMFQPDKEVSQAIYDILKLNFMNLITNHTPYSEDLVDTMDALCSQMAEQIEEAMKQSPAAPTMRLVNKDDDNEL